MNRKESKERIESLKSQYASLFECMDDENVYSVAEKNDIMLSEQADDAEERWKAFPNDEREYEAVFWSYRELEIMWDACESRLRTIATTTTDSTKRTLLATQINESHENVVTYGKKATGTIVSSVDNSGGAAESLQNVGNALNTVGGAMKDSGHKMTVGCTVPILIAIALMILLMLLL